MTPTQTQADLMPCPFCGSAAKVFGAFDAWSVNCTGCNAYGPSANKQDAIAGWNRRAATASIAPALPEGFVLAPKKPTEQMMLAAVERAPCIIREHYARDGKYTGTVTSLNNEMFGEAYAAMLAAVPQLPASTEPAPQGRRKILMLSGMIDVTPAQTAPAEPMPSPSAITAWLETPDGKAAVVRAYAKLQGDIAGLNEARAVSHADLNEPMPSTASEDEPPQAFADILGRYDIWRKDDVQIIWDDIRAALAKPSTIASAENSGVRNDASPEALLRKALSALVTSLADHDDEGMIEHAQQMIDARAALSATAAIAPTEEPVDSSSNGLLKGSSECPICGVDTPHRHADSEIHRWLESQASRFLSGGVVILSKADYEQPVLICQGQPDGMRGNYLVAKQSGQWVPVGAKLYFHPPKKENSDER